ncbi:IMP3 [Cordylochernes scorpioides]|uniref:IMP3 n=1 Tax=Cordylochernes scorpioides TaxID=51811 RepID=A0ABY6LM56_9ARAC|nr:IMP3 [Cordylochernes scorpioides]
MFGSFFQKCHFVVVCKLKYAEQKLLKKVNILSWECDNTSHENRIMRKYYIQKRSEYTVYNKMSRNIRELAKAIAEYDPKDPMREHLTRQLLDYCYKKGLINSTKNLELATMISASAFCRRRLPVIMVKSTMATDLHQATTLIQQGHVRVGPEIVMDPAFFVTRSMEDNITWCDSSKIRMRMKEYNEERDDFELLEG